ncbi:histone-lysine N-methyltransferase SETMAR [Octopus bimaculoides]|uniref:SET domain-containing protein n=1 Tax=Octopus bimaculoides TaxID=37653 RepID=A0A0L8HG55_OCTBM|nr:histone-lysine N-methyltransferase SETMAR [Octopus bimaculoides]
MEDFETQFRGCTCEQVICKPSSCSCIQISGGAAYTEDQRIQQQYFPSTVTSSESELSSPIYECHQDCSCSSNCSNQLVQHGIRFKTEVFSASPDKGFGLRTLEFIPRGSFVSEYAGEVISDNEAKQRTSLIEQQTQMNYILVLKEHYGDKLVQTCVDPTYFGNISRFMNHSCEPNLWMTAVRVSNAVPKLSLFALRDVNSGEELSFHYGGHGTNSIKQKQNTDAENKSSSSSSSSSKLKPCKCGAVTCCGYLPFDETLFH